MRYRNTVAKINLANLYENYKNVSKIVGNKTVIPVVKANAYGHGAVQVTKYLNSKGIDYFAVSLLEEALELREVLPDIDLLCMGIVENEGLLIAIEKNITVTISNFDQIQYLTKVNDIRTVMYSNEKYTEQVQNILQEYFEFDKANVIFKSMNSNDEKQNHISFFQSKLEKIAKKYQIDENLHYYVTDVIFMKKFHDVFVDHDELVKLNIHLKVDTGMNRLGFKYDNEILKSFHSLIDLPYVHLQGIFTHFSTADVDKSYYDIQMNRFKDIFAMLNYNFEMVHISNSSSQIKYEKDIPFTTHTRLGISLYGLTLDENMKFLKNTFQLHTKISQFKYLHKGDKVGYGATYVAKSDEIIGVLPIGYADGFIRKNQNGYVEINKKRYQIVGRICMDQCFIKVDETVSKDDDVILFGQLVSIDEVATRLDTINYEVICQITDRVPREYIQRG